MKKKQKGQYIFSIVGRSGSGKTTLIEKLIRHYVGRGIKIGVIKHARHITRGDTLTQGKDSDRFIRSGAGGSLITNGKDLIFTADDDSGEPVELAGRYFGGFDMIIVEGWKGSALPKMEVIGDSAEPPLYRSGITDIRFVVSRAGAVRDIPCYGADDIEAIAAAIENFPLTEK